MSRPQKHPKTGVYWFRKRVPTDLIPVLGKREEKRSLRTKDPGQAKIEHARVSAGVEAQWQELRKGVQTLSQKQAHALAGEIYRVWVGAFEENPGPPERWEHVLAEDDHATKVSGTGLYIGLTPAEVRVRKLEGRYGPMLKAILDKRGLRLDSSSYRRCLEAFAMAMRQASEHLERNARGDYRPDPDADRFPSAAALVKVPPVAASSTSSASFKDLVAGWAAEKRPSEKTQYSWRRVIDAFTAFLGHDDAFRVTPDDVIRWKADLIAKGLHPNTVRDSKLAAVKAVLQWGVDNRKIPGPNPVSGVKVTGKASPSEKKRGYTDEEAEAVLNAARNEKDPVRRWVPWVCAFTGARVAEVCQLRREDIVEVQGVTCIRITSEAGSVKNTGSERLIPVHPKALAGFVEWARKGGAGPLFTTLKPDRFGSRGGNGTKILGRWVRETVGIMDTRLAPNHAWRHRFKTLCRRHGVPTEFHDALTGHVSGTVGGAYGEFPVDALYREVCKLPSHLPRDSASSESAPAEVTKVEGFAR